MALSIDLSYLEKNVYSHIILTDISMYMIIVVKMNINFIFKTRFINNIRRNWHIIYASING